MSKPKPDYEPLPIFTAAFPQISGNTVNGLGETVRRRASPFFWHPPDKQAFGKLQKTVTSYHQQSPEIRAVFNPNANRGVDPVPQAPKPAERSAGEWTEEVKRTALANEADLVGITPMRPEYVYEGYAIDEPWVILIGVSMDHGSLDLAPPSFEEPEAGVEVGRQYNRAARACRIVRNHILSQGYFAKAWQGPYASALNMMPARSKRASASSGNTAR